jgi:hypothetical protein
MILPRSPRFHQPHQHPETVCSKQSDGAEDLYHHNDLVLAAGRRLGSGDGGNRFWAPALKARFPARPCRSLPAKAHR